MASQPRSPSRASTPPVVPPAKVPHAEIYERYGPQYQQLVECQDYQGNIHAALESLRNSGVFKPSSRVVELGAGGGRLAKVIAPWVESYTALDKSEHMVEIARDNLQGCPNVTVAVADHLNLAPVADGSADVVVAAYTLSYLKKPAMAWAKVPEDNQDYWRVDLDAAFLEIKRILRPGGTVVILETLGTGTETPQRRSYFYMMLEDMGFDKSVLRTDYRFGDLEEARSLASFFWGRKVAERITSATVPEVSALFVWRNAFSEGEAPGR